MIALAETTHLPLPKRLRFKKPPQPIKVERSAEEWRKLINEAKNKETFWAKGIIPGKGEFIGAQFEEVEEY